MRDEFNEISFILNIWLFKSTQNLKKQKKKKKTKQNKIIVTMMIITHFLLHLPYTQNYMD